MRKDRFAFTILEIMVVIALLGLLVAIVIPHVMNARDRGNQKSCLNNLRQIDQAVQLWAMETKALPTDVVTHTNVIPYLRKLPFCPAVRGGSFLSDYGLTFVEDSSFCIANVSLASMPHSLNTDSASAIAVADSPQNSVTENFPKPRKSILKD